MSPLKTFSRRAWARSALGTLLLTGCATTQQPAPSDDAPPPAVPAAQAASAEAVRSLGVELKHLDRDVRPQDDFYTFVNGNWLKTTSIPADRARYGTIIELVDKAELAMRAIIEESAAAKERPRAPPRRRWVISTIASWTPSTSSRWA